MKRILKLGGLLCLTLSVTAQTTGNVMITNAGAFTSGPNLYVQCLLNNCNPNTEFDAYNASTAFTEVSTFC